MKIKINIYRSSGQWYGARWIGGEYDGCDEMDIDGGASEIEAAAAARTMPLTVDGEREISRVEDAR